MPRGGGWHIIMNSDDADFGGSGMFSAEKVSATATPWHGRPFSLEFTLPPLATIFLQPEPEGQE